MEKYLDVSNVVWILVKCRKLTYVFACVGSSVRVYKLLELRLCDLQWNTVSILTLVYIFVIILCSFLMCADFFVYVFVLLYYD